MLCMVVGEVLRRRVAHGFFFALAMVFFFLLVGLGFCFAHGERSSCVCRAVLPKDCGAVC